MLQHGVAQQLRLHPTRFRGSRRRHSAVAARQLLQVERLQHGRRDAAENQRGEDRDRQHLTAYTALGAHAQTDGVVVRGSVSLSLCTTADPLSTTFTNIFGVSIS